MKKKCLILAAVLAVLAGFLTGCAGKPKELMSQIGFSFDTVITIKLEEPEGKDGETLLRKCFSLCLEYEKIFSRTRKDSELYRLNHRTAQSVKVSQPMAELISKGLEYGELAGNRFDITLAPVLELWDFKTESPSLPDEKQLKAALKKVDATKVHVNGDTVTFDSPDTQIDLGAIVKGWAADQLKEYLVSQGVSRATVNLGGNAVTIGEKADGVPWKVGIQKPYSDRGELITAVESLKGSVVSSGTYERYFELDGKKYFHILDPVTGYPVKTDLSQVTVISESSLQGDLLSTTCLILGYERGKALLEEQGAEGIFVSASGEILP